MSKQEVSITEISALLTVDQWFDKFQFSKKTGVIISSCNRRLKYLFDGGYLERKTGPARTNLYRMTEEMQLSMIERGKINQTFREKVPAEEKKKKREMAKLKKAVQCDKKATAENILKSIGFI